MDILITGAGQGLSLHDTALPRRGRYRIHNGSPFAVTCRKNSMTAEKDLPHPCIQLSWM